MHYLLLYQYTLHWLLLCERIIMLNSYSIVDFYCPMMGLFIHIYELFWLRSQCKVSDTQETVKAYGIIIIKYGRMLWVGVSNYFLWKCKVQFAFKSKDDILVVKTVDWNFDRDRNTWYVLKQWKQVWRRQLLCITDIYTVVWYITPF